MKEAPLNCRGYFTASFGCRCANICLNVINIVKCSEGKKGSAAPFIKSIYHSECPSRRYEYALFVSSETP